MRSRLVGIAACALALGLADAALAAPPTRITIVSVFNPIRFGDKDYVNGQLFGDAPGGQVVQLEQAPAPFTVWTPVGQTTTDPEGYYSFKLRPGQTMQYRTSSQGTPSERVVQISVAPRLAFSASAGKASVRFGGSINPARPGEAIAIQRRTRSGWKTAAVAHLRAGRTFAGRLHVRKPTDLRALFVSDGAFLRATSRAVTARPGA